MPDLGQIQIYAVRNQGGGNCQFEAIAQALELEGGHRVVRNRIAEAIMSDVRGDVVSNLMLPSMVAQEPLNYSRVAHVRPEDLRRRMAELVRTPNFWGDELTLEYASAIWSACFVLIRANTACALVTKNVGCEFHSNITILLKYSLDQHYELAIVDSPRLGGPLRFLSKWDDPTHALIIERLLA